MKYLYVIFAFFLFSCQTRQEELFQKFEILVKKVEHLEKRLQELSEFSPEGYSYITIEVSNHYYGNVVDCMDFIFETISVGDLSREEYNAIIHLMEVMEELILKMEEALDIDSPQEKRLRVAESFF